MKLDDRFNLNNISLTGEDNATKGSTYNFEGKEYSRNTSGFGGNCIT
jgi:hypothetical protein